MLGLIFNKSLETAWYCIINLFLSTHATVNNHQVLMAYWKPNEERIRTPGLLIDTLHMFHPFPMTRICIILKKCTISLTCIYVVKSWNMLPLTQSWSIQTSTRSCIPFNIVFERRQKKNRSCEMSQKMWKIKFKSTDALKWTFF